ncbi:MAG: bifunctional folylpolyglutamate synthase/dihydrofolate synthase [Bacteroidetes bacterium]|jgi:dihydrofolate synthase/folylpolyglutamate synthase|nr:bifunctional folylpolyglutamate synthase/dihydrofolate synthase [Bacteroidota bacterium]
MNYDKALDYILTKLPMYQRIGKAAYRADLTTSHKLDEHLGWQHKQFRSIHVAGTNGKGSVCHLLASVLQEAGYQVGLHTSPHFTDFRERIKVNGIMIPERDVAEFTECNQHFFDEIKPSFFEMSVFMAFWYFARQQVDYAIIEVGMGGRLDSTNVITPVLSVITNIGLDHTQYLGDTLEKIAGEKAGIIKEGVPVVIGQTQPETAPVFEATAREKKSRLFFADQRISEQHIKELIAGDHEPVMSLEAQPAYRVKNMITTYGAILMLTEQHVELPEDAYLRGIQNLSVNTGFKGRWQILGEHPLVICDSGHNTDGLQLVVEQLKQLKAKDYHIILSFVSDKEITEALKLFPGDWNYLFTQSSVERAMPADELASKALTVGLIGETIPEPQEAFQLSLLKAGSEDVLFIGGSSFLVADILKLKKM